MAQCSVQTGMLFWKKLCSGVAVGHCGNCHRLVCRDHFMPQSEGPFLCPACAPREDDADTDSTGSLFSFRFGSAAAAAGAAGAAEGREVESSDSGSGDSGGGDSGGGGSGGDGGSSSD